MTERDQEPREKGIFYQDHAHNSPTLGDLFTGDVYYTPKNLGGSPSEGNADTLEASRQVEAVRTISELASAKPTPTKKERAAEARNASVKSLLSQIQDARTAGPVQTRSGRTGVDHVRARMAKKRPI